MDKESQVRVSFLAALLLSGALATDAAAAQLAQLDNRVVKKAVERNYTDVLKDANGAPVLRLTVEYIGKAPKGTFKSPHPCITENLNTDFYYVTWENLTEHDIEFVAGERTFDNELRSPKTIKTEKGQQEVVEARRRIDMKTEFAGDRLLRAKEKREWRNMFYCDRALDHNVLRQLYTVRHLDKEYKIEFYRVFEK